MEPRTETSPPHSGASPSRLGSVAEHGEEQLSAKQRRTIRPPHVRHQSQRRDTLLRVSPKVPPGATQIPDHHRFGPVYDWGVVVRRRRCWTPRARGQAAAAERQSRSAGVDQGGSVHRTPSPSEGPNGTWASAPTGWPWSPKSRPLTRRGVDSLLHPRPAARESRSSQGQAARAAREGGACRARPDVVCQSQRTTPVANYRPPP